METVNSVLDLIGNTPILKLSKFDTGPCDLYIKMESENPGGSIKDRIAVCMIEAAEKEGNQTTGGVETDALANLAIVSPDVRKRGLQGKENRALTSGPIPRDHRDLDVVDVSKPSC